MSSLLDLVLIDLHECDRERLVDLDAIRNGMLKAAEVMGAEVVGESFHTFEPWGISGTVTIAESHLAVHTWPEYHFAAVTFETCGSNMKLRAACDFMIGFFRARRPQITYQKRGLMDVPETELAYKQVAG